MLVLVFVCVWVWLLLLCMWVLVLVLVLVSVWLAVGVCLSDSLILAGISTNTHKTRSIGTSEWPFSPCTAVGIILKRNDQKEIEI